MPLGRRPRREAAQDQPDEQRYQGVDRAEILVVGRGQNGEPSTRNRITVSSRVSGQRYWWTMLQE